MHPFIPFVTEEIWQNLKVKDTPLSSQSWPSTNKKFIDKKLEERMSDIFFESITKVRDVKTQFHLPPVPCNFSSSDSQALGVVMGSGDTFENLTGNAVSFNENVDYSKSVTIVVGPLKIQINLGDLNFDIEKEKEKIRNQITEQRKLADNIAHRLKNKDFVSKAPKNVVDADKARLQTMETKIRELKATIKNLG